MELRFVIKTKNYEFKSYIIIFPLKTKYMKMS